MTPAVPEHPHGAPMVLVPSTPTMAAALHMAVPHPTAAARELLLGHLAQRHLLRRDSVTAPRPQPMAATLGAERHLLTASRLPLLAQAATTHGATHPVRADPPTTLQLQGLILALLPRPLLMPPHQVHIQLRPQRRSAPRPPVPGKVDGVPRRRPHRLLVHPHRLRAAATTVLPRRVRMAVLPKPRRRVVPGTLMTTERWVGGRSIWCVG